MSILEAHHLYRFYRSDTDEVAALDDVSLTVDPGEVVAVIGPSGSGKSTLIRVLAGLEEPDGGRVVVAGERMTHVPERVKSSLRGRFIGLLLQSGNLIEHLSVRDNVRLAGAIAGRGDEADGALEAAGIAHRASFFPSELSGGESARAAMAVALARPPAVLLADEPTAEVDRVNEDAVMEAMRRLVDEGAACLLVTHSERATCIANRVLELRDGALCEG